METKELIIKKLNDYEQRFNNEQERLKPFSTFLLSTPNEQLFDRKNFVGHITASAFILNSNSNALLMIRHKALNRWLQPGGHIDVNDQLLISAALREVEEETGINLESLQPVYNYIFDIDSHAIPANANKMEPAHVHHDIRFLFTCKETASFIIDDNEVTGCEWISLTDLNKYPDFHIVLEKISTMTS